MIEDFALSYLADIAVELLRSVINVVDDDHTEVLFPNSLIALRSTGSCNILVDAAQALEIASPTLELSVVMRDDERRNAEAVEDAEAIASRACDSTYTSGLVSETTFTASEMIALMSEESETFKK